MSTPKVIGPAGTFPGFSGAHSPQDSKVPGGQESGSSYGGGVYPSQRHR